MTWSPGTDREWRLEASLKIASLCEPSWPDSYRGHVTEISEFIVARIEGTLTRGGRLTWRDCKADCIVYFDRIPLSGISIMNPDRVERAVRGYPQLREQLKLDPSYDSVPISLKRLGREFTVWDGHHRLRTYRQAGRPDIPAIVAWIVPGTGQVKTVSPRRAEPVGTGTGSLGPGA